MSDLSVGLIEQGIEQGMQEGMIQAITKNILSMIKHGISKEKAFDILEMDDTIKQAVLEKLKEEQ